MDLPAQVLTGLVTGLFTKAVGDTIDAGVEPDQVALAGQVTFTPDLVGGRLRVDDATPPVTIIVRPVPVTLDAGGALSVRLPADPSYTWHADFNLDGVYVAPFTFQPVAGQTVDLTIVAPTETANGGELYIAQAVASAASAAASAASAAASAALVGAPADVAVAAIVGNPASATRGALSSTFGRRWQPLTAYLAGDVVTNPTGDAVTAKVNFTTGAAYVAADWNLSPTSAIAVAPRLSWSHVANRTGLQNGWETQGVEGYVVFAAYYHSYDVAYKNNGAIYALARQLTNGTTQGVWRSRDGGVTWTKLFDLTISQATKVWYESIFVETSAETIYVQKTTTGYDPPPLHNYVESYGPTGVFKGSKDVGDSHWVSSSQTIDACPNAAFTQRIVIFGEYSSDAKATVNVWRTIDQGVTWTSVLSGTGNNGVSGAGEFRHIHVIAADPYTKHWWMGSGDVDSQCKIYRSTDFGVTWTLLWGGTQRERTLAFVFTATDVYYGMDSAQFTLDHSKIVKIRKSDLTRTDVATVKDGFPVWMLTKTFAPEGFIVWPSCEFAANTRQDYVTVQWFDLATGLLSDIGRLSIKDYTTGTEGIHDASRYQDLVTGNILFSLTQNILLRGGLTSGLVSTFVRGRLSLST